MKFTFLVDTHPCPRKPSEKSKQAFQVPTNCTVQGTPSQLLPIGQHPPARSRDTERAVQFLASLQIGDTPAGQLIPLLPLSRYYGAAALV